MSGEKSTDKTIRSFNQSVDDKGRPKPMSLVKLSSNRHSALKGSIIKTSQMPTVSQLKDVNKSIRQLKFEIVTPTQGMRRTESIFNDNFSSKSLFMMSRPVVTR